MPRNNILAPLPGGGLAAEIAAEAARKDLQEPGPLGGRAEDPVLAPLANGPDPDGSSLTLALPVDGPGPDAPADPRLAVPSGRGVDEAPPGEFGLGPASRFVGYPPPGAPALLATRPPDNSVWSGNASPGAWVPPGAPPMAPGIPQGPGEPLAQGDSLTAGSGDYWRNVMEGMYRRFNPEKLQDLDNILAKYRGSEPVLYQALCEKYMPAPPVQPVQPVQPWPPAPSPMGQPPPGWHGPPPGPPPQPQAPHWWHGAPPQGPYYHPGQHPLPAQQPQQQQVGGPAAARRSQSRNRSRSRSR